MRMVLEGTIVQVGDNCGKPTVNILLPDEIKRTADDDDEMLYEEPDQLELRISSKEDASQIAKHLYGRVRISIEIIPTPKLVVDEG